MRFDDDNQNTRRTVTHPFFGAVHGDEEGEASERETEVSGACQSVLIEMYAGRRTQRQLRKR